MASRFGIEHEAICNALAANDREGYRMTRARKIVCLAAVKKTSASEWLRMDERGIHEQHAEQLLRETADKAAALGMAEDEVDRQIAVMIAFNAVDAMLRRKGKGK